MNIYLQTYIVQAEPDQHEDGRPGYAVYFPDGRTLWMYAEDFELHHRPLDRRERTMVEMTSEELGVARITDKDYQDLEDPDSTPMADTKLETCEHDWSYHLTDGRLQCAKCGLVR